jgi:iron complex transport system substrate-binding protein
MKRLAQIVALVVVALLTSCSNKGTLHSTEPLYTPHYAKGFAIERDTKDGAKYLVVHNPWQGAEGATFRIEIDSLNPPKRIVAMSSSHAAMIDAIGCADRIVGLSGCRYIYSPTIRQAIETGQICEVGYDSAFDFEKICTLNADVVLLYGVAGEAKRITGKFDELGIPYIYIGEYLEAEPLGKAEWIVAIASLCGEEQRGREFFASVEKRYNLLREQSKRLTPRPRVMVNLPYRDTWFMPPHNSYMVRLIEDAGGEYILKARDEGQGTREDRNSNKSTVISLEEALELALQCDYWINLGQFASKQELCAVAPHFTGVNAVRFDRLYNNTKRTNESRGSDFWESGAIRPDLILADLVEILHYNSPSDSLYYYKKLE